MVCAFRPLCPHVPRGHAGVLFQAVPIRSITAELSSSCGVASRETGGLGAFDAVVALKATFDARTTLDLD